MKNLITKAMLRFALPLSLLTIFGCTTPGPITTEQANYPVNRIDAKAIFAENCATCHGADGRAETSHGRLVHAKNLTDPKWQTATADADIIAAIKTGPGMMPAFEGKLSPSEIEAVAAHVRSFAAAH